jgi:hypothetical protein
MLRRKFWREKTLGEIWAAIIKTINSPPGRRDFGRGGPKLGAKPESVDAHKVTMLDIFAMCLEKKIAQVHTLIKQCTVLQEES